MFSTKRSSSTIKSYFTYSTHETMKFLSNFDSWLEQKLLCKYKKKFGDKCVLSIHRSPYYYRRYIGIPLFVYLALLLISGYFIFSHETLPKRWIWVFLVVFGMYGLILFFKLAHKRIDYKMDFVLVTPHEIIKYDQQGVFGRTVETIPTHKIKSISTDKPGLFYSFFNLGSIDFLSEWDSEQGDIHLKYVDNVDTMILQINKIIGL